MSITRGLVELKLLDKRIGKSINDATFCSYQVGSNGVKGYKSVEEFNEDAKKKHQSVTALIKRREVIKSSIVESNAKTKIRIAGEEMTVADAIERRNHSISYEQQLLEKLRRDLNNAINNMEKENEEAKYRLEQQLQMMAGKEGKVKTEDTAATTEFFWKHNQANLIDPIEARAEIEKLSKKIDDFLAEVDFALSESNVVTKIIIS